MLIYDYLKFRNDPFITSEEIANYISVALAVALSVDSTVPLLSKSKISSLLPSSVAVQPGLCRTWSETP